jgi:hypothetical protein
LYKIIKIVWKVCDFSSSFISLRVTGRDKNEQGKPQKCSMMVENCDVRGVIHCIKNKNSGFSSSKFKEQGNVHLYKQEPCQKFRQGKAQIFILYINKNVYFLD